MQALTKLFWRNPAAAKQPREWTKEEKEALLTAVRCVAATQQQADLINSFRAQVATGTDPAALKRGLAQQLEALGAQGSSGERTDRGCASSIAALHHATARFSLMEWQSVAQQVGDRCAPLAAAVQAVPMRWLRAHVRPVEQTAVAVGGIAVVRHLHTTSNDADMVLSLNVQIYSIV